MHANKQINQEMNKTNKYIKKQIQKERHELGKIMVLLTQVVKQNPTQCTRIRVVDDIGTSVDRTRPRAPQQKNTLEH